jgi:DNA/RNA endonuclease YhcR with UshA esterase domain
MRCMPIALLAALAFSAPAFAEDAAPATPPATPPASQPTTAGAVVDVKDLDKIKAAVGKELSVRGKVSGTFKSKTGSVIILNFEGVNRDFVAAVAKENIDTVNAGYEGDVAKAVEGKTIVVTGPIKLYKEKPELMISKPDQIKIEAGDAKPADEKPADK